MKKGMEQSMKFATIQELKDEYVEEYAINCINPQTAKVKIEQQNSLNVAVTSEIQIMMDVEPIQ